MTGDGCTWTGIACNANGRVTKIDIQNNNVIGTLPTSISGLARLTLLFVDGNPKLGGTFPDVFYALSVLNSVTASGCNFTGPMPFATGPLSSTIQEVDFSNNQISGSIPATMATLSGLKYVF